MVEGVPSQADWWPQVMDPLRRFGHRVAEFFSPLSDATSSKDAYVIEIELPGVKEEDIHVEVHGDQMTVSGEKRNSRDEKTDSYIFSERTYGAFRRSFRFPPDVDESGIEAHCEDGILRLTLPKKSEIAEGKRKIEIQRPMKGVTGDPRPNFE
ncbi:MAG: Hsp20/alpha crystallin family protein [Thalassobaculum sp.]|jgi:HSP20 family protein